MKNSQRLDNSTLDPVCYTTELSGTYEATVISLWKEFWSTLHYNLTYNHIDLVKAHGLGEATGPNGKTIFVFC